jgi:hypothetical protein
MGKAEKFLGFILLILAVVAFINHGQLAFGSTPKGASFTTAFYGLVP